MTGEIGEAEDVRGFDGVVQPGQLAFRVLPQLVEDVDGKGFGAESAAQALDEQLEGIFRVDDESRMIQLVDDLLPRQLGRQFRDGLDEDLHVPRGRRIGSRGCGFVLVGGVGRRRRREAVQPDVVLTVGFVAGFGHHGEGRGDAVRRQLGQAHLRQIGLM